MPIVFVPGIIISLARYIHFANAEFTDVQTVVFTSYHYLFKSYALEGTAKQNGLSICIRTTHSFNIYNYHRYMNTDVLVGYDPKWDKWVVIEHKGELTTPLSFDDIIVLFVTIISRGTYICLNSGVMAQTFQSL